MLINVKRALLEFVVFAALAVGIVLSSYAGIDKRIIIILAMLLIPVAITYVAFKYFSRCLDDISESLGMYISKFFGEKVGKHFAWWFNGLPGWIAMIFSVAVLWANFSPLFS